LPDMGGMADVRGWAALVQALRAAKARTGNMIAFME